MPLRRLYVLVLVAFAVIFTATSSWMAFSVTNRALEDELDDKLRVTAAVAAATGLDAGNLLLLTRGDEGNQFWTDAYERLRSLVDRGYVDAAWIIRRESPASPGEGALPGGEGAIDRLPSYTAIVSTESADSLPIIGNGRLHLLRLRPERTLGERIGNQHSLRRHGRPLLQVRFRAA